MYFHKHLKPRHNNRKKLTLTRYFKQFLNEIVIIVKNSIVVICFRVFMIIII